MPTRTCRQFYDHGNLITDPKSGELTDNQSTTQRGFTLIELLIVIVIIGIVSTVTLYAFGDFGASRKARVAAEQFASYLKLVEQRAILETTTFGITINPAGYATYRLDNQSKWNPMPQNNFFHGQSFPTQVVIHVQSLAQKNHKTPDIIINPSGDMSAFILFFGTKTNPQLIQLIGKHNGDIVLQNAPST